MTVFETEEDVEGGIIDGGDTANGLVGAGIDDVEAHDG